MENLVLENDWVIIREVGRSCVTEGCDKNLNCRQARWALYLSRFDFILKHIPGSKMGKADGVR